MTSCGCQRSFGIVCAILASIGVALFLAGDACTAAGGQVSETAWVCVSGPDATLLWSYVTPRIGALAAILAGLPAYLAAIALARAR